MKLVREHINEIFTPDSDPIHDLGIGVEHIINKFKKELYEELPWMLEEDLFKYFPDKRIIDIDCWPLTKEAFNNLITCLNKVLKNYKGILKIVKIPHFSDIVWNAADVFIKIQVV